MIKQTSLIENYILPLLEEHKAKDCIVLHVNHLTDITDHMVICTGTSNRHVRTLADYLVTMAKKNNLPILGVEGLTEGEWVLIDLVDVIIHIMLPEIREFYNLEKLWGTPPA